MAWSVALILIAVAIAIVDRFKLPRQTNIVVTLIVLAAVINFFIVWNQEKETAKSKQYGILEPKSKERHKADTRNFTTWEFGTNFKDKRGTTFRYTAGKSFSEAFKTTWTKPLDDMALTIGEEDGQLKVTVLLRDIDGRVIAALVDNEWKINHPVKSFDRNYTKDMLEVKNDNNDVVLQIRLLPDKVQLNGIFYDSDGKGIAIFPHKRDQASIMVLLDKEHPPASGTIKPLFKYPSDLYFGELVDEAGKK